MSDKKAHRPPLDYPVERILEAIKGCNSIVSKVADKLMCDWSTAKKYVEMYPETRAAMNDELQRAIDMAETKVLKSINLDDIQSAKWFLSKKAKDRGYGDETNINLNVTDSPRLEQITPEQIAAIDSILNGNSSTDTNAVPGERKGQK